VEWAPAPCAPTLHPVAIDIHAQEANMHANLDPEVRRFRARAALV
jgi:hypothetical protein